MGREGSAGPHSAPNSGWGCKPILVLDLVAERGQEGEPHPPVPGPQTRLSCSQTSAYSCCSLGQREAVQVQDSLPAVMLGQVAHLPRWHWGPKSPCRSQGLHLQTTNKPGCVHARGLRLERLRQGVAFPPNSSVRKAPGSGRPACFMAAEGHLRGLLRSPSDLPVVTGPPSGGIPWNCRYSSQSQASSTVPFLKGQRQGKSGTKNSWVPDQGL